MERKGRKYAFGHWLLWFWSFDHTYQQQRGLVVFATTKLIHTYQTWAEADKDAWQWRRADKEHHGEHYSPWGATLWRKREREREMDDDHMKMLYHMQHISSASTHRQLSMCREILGIRKQCCVLCVWRTNCTVQMGRNLKCWLTHTAYLTHKYNWI